MIVSDSFMKFFILFYAEVVRNLKGPSKMKVNQSLGLKFRKIITKITERNTSPTAFNSHFLFIHSCPLVPLCILTLLLTLFFPWPS